MQTEALQSNDERDTGLPDSAKTLARLVPVNGWVCGCGVRTSNDVNICMSRVGASCVCMIYALLHARLNV